MAVTVLGEISAHEFANGDNNASETVNVTPEATPQETPQGPTDKPADKPAEDPKPAVETTRPGSEPTNPANPAPKAPAAETATAPKDWKELLKDADLTEVLKAAGLDDFDIEFHKLRKDGVDPYKFLEAKTRDWSKMSSEEVLRHDLKQQYSDMSAEDFELLADMEINQKYKIGENFTDEKEKRTAELRLKLAADQLRKKFTEEDKKFLIPERKPDDEVQLRQQEQERKRQEVLAMVEEDEATKALLSTKKIILGEGENAIPVDVNPEEILDVVKNENNFWPLFNKPVLNAAGEKTGDKFDWGLLYKAIQYIKDPTGFEKRIFDSGKSKGVQAEKEDIHNIPKDKNVTTDAKPKESLNDAFSKRGSEVPAN